MPDGVACPPALDTSTARKHHAHTLYRLSLNTLESKEIDPNKVGSTTRPKVLKSLCHRELTPCPVHRLSAGTPAQE